MILNNLLQNVDVKTDLGPKLVKLYDELPDSANDIPTQSTDDLKDFLIRLRPFVSLIVSA